MVTLSVGVGAGVKVMWSGTLSHLSKSSPRYSQVRLHTRCLSAVLEEPRIFYHNTCVSDRVHDIMTVNTPFPLSQSEAN